MTGDGFYGFVQGINAHGNVKGNCRWSMASFLALVLTPTLSVTLSQLWRERHFLYLRGKVLLGGHHRGRVCLGIVSGEGDIRWVSDVRAIVGEMEGNRGSEADPLPSHRLPFPLSPIHTMHSLGWHFALVVVQGILAGECALVGAVRCQHRRTEHRLQRIQNLYEIRTK